MESEFNLKPKEIAKRLTANEKIALVGKKHGFSPRQANAVTKARLNNALAELAEGNVANVQMWLEQVAARAPKEAIELYMSLLEFSQPRLKAAQIVGTANLTPSDGKTLAGMSIEELNVIAEQG
jgi:hypothetical protein